LAAEVGIYRARADCHGKWHLCASERVALEVEAANPAALAGVVPAIAMTFQAVRA